MNGAGTQVEAKVAGGREMRVPEGAELLKPWQAALLVQVCPSTIREWVHKGKLRRYGEGRIWRVRRAELLALMERAGQPAGADDVAASIFQKASH